MAVKQLPIADASLEQLRDFANLSAGLGVSPNCNRPTIIAKLATAGFNDFIWVEDAPVAPIAAGFGLHVGASDLMANPPNEKDPTYQDWINTKVSVIIATNDGPGGQDPVELGLNERMILVPRGQPVPLARKYVKVLEESVRWVYDPNPDGNGYRPARAVLLYPFQILGLADQAIAA